LRLEQLEARDVLAAVLPNDVYLASVYQGFLNRAIETGGLDFWRPQLNASSREAVADRILHSPEWHGRQLQLLYQELLNRPLDTTGLLFWGNVLESGGTYEQVKAGILGSPEYFADSGNTFNSWLTAVYRSQLGRDPGPAGFGFWLPQFSGFQSLQPIAARILASQEAHTVEMDGIYRNILSRPLDGLGATFWDNVLASGTTVDDVLARVVASPEFFGQLNTFLLSNTVTFDDPDIVAGAFLNQFGKFSAVLPGVEQLDRVLVTFGFLRTARTTSPPPAAVVNPLGASTANTVNVTAAAASPGFTFTPATITTGVSPFVGTGGTTTSPGFLITTPTVLAPNPQTVSISGTNPTTNVLGTNSTIAPVNVDSTSSTVGVNPTTVSNFAPLTTTLSSPIVVGGPMSFLL
jgi:hypothetical protein